MGAGKFGRLFQLIGRQGLARILGLAVGKIHGDGSGEEVGFLRHITDLVADGFYGLCENRLTVKEDVSRFNGVQA